MAFSEVTNSHTRLTDCNRLAIPRRLIIEVAASEASPREVHATKDNRASLSGALGAVHAEAPCRVPSIAVVESSPTLA